MRIRQSSVDRLLDAEDNPIVWQRYASRPSPSGGIDVRVVVLQRDERDGLLAEFGQDWLDEYVASLEVELQFWAMGVTGTVH